MADVYYAIDPNGTGDHKTGSPTLTIASGVATLTVDQSGQDIGVGFEIEYTDSGSQYIYISAVNSGTSFDVTTATGGTPSDVGSAKSIVSINPVFSTIGSAISNYSGASYLNDTDLTAAGANVNMYWPCYGTQHTITATPTITEGTTVTTDSTHRLTIYTPQEDEAFTRQRHSGIYTTSKFYIDCTTDYQVGFQALSGGNYTSEGLQFDLNLTNGNTTAIQFSTGSSGDDLRASHNIVHRVNSGGTAYGFWSSFNASTGGTIKLWNNIVYDCQVGVFNDRFDATRKIVVYHNTLRDHSVYGFQEGGNANLLLKNNIVNDMSAGSCYSGTFDTSSNNIDDDGTSPDVSFRNKEVTFQNEGASPPELLLSSSDTVAINLGADLRADSDLAVTDDILGNARDASPDIGAHEYVSTVTVIEASFYNAAPYTQGESIGTVTATGGQTPYSWKITAQATV